MLWLGERDRDHSHSHYALVLLNFEEVLSGRGNLLSSLRAFEISLNFLVRS